MSSFPLAANQIQPPPNMVNMALEGLRIRSLLQGQRLSDAELTSKNLENQQRGLLVAGQQQAIAAQHDPAWDASDPDQAKKILDKYSVPQDAQNNVLEGIAKAKTLIENASKETLGLVQQTHNFFDDQFQAARNAPADSQQSTYDQAKQNAVQYASKLPSGVREAMLQEIGKAPAAYDQNWLDTQHALLRTGQDLNEAALKKGQAREASGKGAQAEQEAQLAAAKIPGAQAESTMQGQQAAMTPQQRALAGNLPFAEATSVPGAQRALSLETEQKRQAAIAQVQAQAQMYAGNSALAKVPPHLVPAATSEATKLATDYAGAKQAADSMSTFLDMALKGNKEAVRIVPLQGALEITTAQEVHRINRTEVDQYGSAGSLFDRISGSLSGAVTGKNIPDAVLRDMQSMQQAVANSAEGKYRNGLKAVNQNYGSNFQPVQMNDSGGGGQGGGSNGPQPGYTRIQASDGSMHDLPSQNIAAAKKRDPGLQVVQ